MRNRTISKLMVALTVAVFSLAFAGQANAYDFLISDADPRYIGEIDPGTPTSPTDEVGYINTLIAMAINTTQTIGTNFYDRSDNACGVAPITSCPMATIVGGDTDNDPGAGTLNLGSGWTYLYVKYGGESHVWYVGGLTGTGHTFPLNDVGGQGASHYALYNPGTTTVPEPTTLLLLGSGLAALGVFGRRRFRK